MLAVRSPRLSCMSMLTRVWLTKLHTARLLSVCLEFWEERDRIVTLSSKHGSEEAYCDGFLDVVESEGVVSAGCEAAGSNDYHERLGGLIYCSEGRNNRSLILCKASNSHLTTQILSLASVQTTRDPTVSISVGIPIVTPITNSDFSNIQSGRLFRTFEKFYFKYFKWLNFIQTTETDLEDGVRALLRLCQSGRLVQTM